MFTFVPNVVAIGDGGPGDPVAESGRSWKQFADEFGRGDLVWFPIHDELVLHVLDPLVGQVMAEVEQCMRFDFMGVPISASAVPLLEPDGTSRWMTSKHADKYAQERSAAGMADPAGQAVPQNQH